jgi:5'-nucleotidase (lipoprotein e(P4) family)
MRNFLIPILVITIFATYLTSCQPCEKNSGKCSQNHTIQATYYYQTAAENAALYHQGFNIAKMRVDQIASQKFGKQPAVVLDIDETVLDNSYFQVESIQKGEPYTPERWDAWVKTEVAKPVPGGVEFINYVLSKGVVVIYVTNRSESVREQTIRNMIAVGFPEVPSENYFFKTDVSDKTARRQMVSEKYDIQLLMGDNLSDFSSVFDDRSQQNGFNTVEKNKEEFGLRYIIFPNPTYGDWQKPVLTVNDSCAEQLMLKRLRRI